MLQYYVKNAFSPIMVSGFLTADRMLNVYIASDLQIAVPKATLSIEVFKFNSLVAQNRTRITVDIEPLESKLVYSTDVDEFLTSVGCGDKVTSRDACFIYLGLEKDTVVIAPDNFVIAGSNIKSAAKPNLQIQKVIQVDDSGKNYSVAVSTDQVTLFVWLDTHGIAGRFSDNGFIQVETNKIVYFTSDEPTSLSVLKQQLSVICLMDVNFSK